MHKQKGFTLIELMIVVAIIGILASIAVPGFLQMQLRAKLAEIPANVDGIKTAEMAYNAAYDKLIPQTRFVPSEGVGRMHMDWKFGSNFDTIGWAPDGNVRGAYKVDVKVEDFIVYGISDVDGDGTNATYTAMRDTNATAVTSRMVY